jgi:hypothetical protein
MRNNTLSEIYANENMCLEYSFLNASKINDFLKYKTNLNYEYNE